MAVLEIGIPFIRENEDRVQLVSNISENGKNYELWYEVAKEYGEYLTTERIDAFFVALLPLAMKEQLNIVSKGVISEKLYFQTTKFLIPVLAKYSKNYNAIEIAIENKSNQCINTQGKNATGFSRGVDSFDTVKDILNNGDFSLTHLTFFNVGSHKSSSGFSAEESRALYQKRIKVSKESSKIINLPLVDVNSNLGEHLALEYVKIHHFCSFSAVLALQKLFKNYYYSSGYPLSDFSIKKCDKGSAFYEPVLSNMLSTESTSFHITGLDKTRLEKVKSISDYEPSYNNLNICFNSESNCGKCEKCIRTQLELYSLGKLELYKGSFDVDSFYANIDKYIDYMLKHQNQIAYKEILQQFEKSGINLSFSQKLKKSVYALAIKILKK